MGLIDRAIPRPMQTLAKRIMPDLGSFLKHMEDPDLLHEQISQVYNSLGIVLNADHEAGYGGGDRCQCSDNSTSEQSVSSGTDGNGEVDADGSLDEGIPESV